MSDSAIQEHPSRDLLSLNNGLKNHYEVHKLKMGDYEHIPYTSYCSDSNHLFVHNPHICSGFSKVPLMGVKKIRMEMLTPPKKCLLALPQFSKTQLTLRQLHCTSRPPYANLAYKAEIWQWGILTKPIERLTSNSYFVGNGKKEWIL